jgi:hypothetical protein
MHTLKSKTKQLDLLETDIYTLRKENRLLFKELSLLRSACVTPSKTETLSDADKLMNSTYNVPILNKRLLLDNRKYLCTIYRKTTNIGKGLIFGCVYVYIYMVNRKLSTNYIEKKFTTQTKKRHSIIAMCTNCVNNTHWKIDSLHVHLSCIHL